MDAPSRTALASEVISELGILLLQNECTGQPLALNVLGALSWIDSNASIKATYLTGPIVRLLVADGSLTGSMAARIMVCILHGQHDANQGLLLTLGAQLYETMRPLFPDDLQKLNERISSGTSKGHKVEKIKKDLFKKIIGPLIGQSIGQQFRKVQITDLPRLELTKKHVPDILNVFLLI